MITNEQKQTIKEQEQFKKILYESKNYSIAYVRLLNKLFKQELLRRQILLSVEIWT